MEYYEKDGVFTCITSSREGMRQHLRDIARVRQQRTQRRTEQVLREKGVFVGPRNTLQKVHDEIMDGKSSYPAHHQAELLLEAGRIGVWETQSKFHLPSFLSTANRTGAFRAVIASTFFSCT